MITISAGRTLSLKDGFSFITLDKLNQIWLDTTDDDPDGRFPLKSVNVATVVQRLKDYGNSVVEIQYAVLKQFLDQDSKKYDRRIKKIADSAGYKVVGKKNKVVRGNVFPLTFITTIKR